MQSEKLAHIERAGFILRPDSSLEIKEVFISIKKQFEEAGIEVLLAKESAVMIGVEGVDFTQMCERCDFLVSLGGDGTLLSLVRNSYKYHKPNLWSVSTPGIWGFWRM